MSEQPHLPVRPDTGEGRDRVGLALLWITSWASLLWLWPQRPDGVTVAAAIGTLGLAVLVIRMAVVHFSGYERFVGLRIIRRPDGPRRGRSFLIACWVLVFLGLAGMLTIRFGYAEAPWVTHPEQTQMWQFIRLGLVTLVAAGTFIGLLMLIAQRFSVFGTTSIFGVVLGAAALLVVQSVATGFLHEFEHRVLGVYAHINVTRPYGIPEYRRFEAWLRTLEGVEGASPFVYYAMAIAPAEVESDEHGDIQLASVLVKGIEPTTADQVIDVVEHLKRGSGREVDLRELRSDIVLRPVPDRDDALLPAAVAATRDPRGQAAYERQMADYEAVARDNPERLADRIERRIAMDDDDWIDPPDVTAAEVARSNRDSLPTMFIGGTLAAELDLKVGAVVRLVDPGASFDTSEEPRFTHYVIAGIFQAGFQEYDARLVYVDIKELQRFKYRGQDVVSGVDLRLSDPELAPIVGAAIRAELSDEYSVLEWQKLNENLFSSIRTQKNALTIVVSLVIVVASFNVLSALWTMVLRRTPEVAILVSMGGTGPQIGRVFQLTGMAIGLAGAVAGVVFGLTICLLVELYGYALDPEVYFIERLPVEISLMHIAGVLGFSLSICFVATIPAAMYASSLRPVEGLRYE